MHIRTLAEDLRLLYNEAKPAVLAEDGTSTQTSPTMAPVMDKPSVRRVKRESAEPLNPKAV